MEQAKGRYVVFLNNDTIMTAGWLEGLIGRLLREWPSAGLVGPVSNGAMDAQCIRPDYTDLADLDAFAARRRKAFAGKMQAVQRLTGFCLLVRREVLERIGRLDERYGMGLFEDDDLCVRAREAGYRLLIALDVYIHHFGNRTFQQLGLDTRQRLEANFELFRAKWGAEYFAGYHLPPLPPPATETADATATTPALAVIDSSIPVSLSMIVRNEEHHLPDCLRSVNGLFQDIIVVDTGSTDGTRAVAESFGARVFDFPWPDSFGAARNESLRHARGKWILWLDADDRLDEENRRQLETVLADLGDELDAYAMKVRSVLDSQRSSFRLLDQVRLFRNSPAIRWDYRIHEQILPAVNRVGGVVRWADVIIDHVGYVDASARRRKLERNLNLLELDYAERPDDGFTLFNLGWTLLDLGRTSEALTHLQVALEKTKPTSSTLRKLYHLLALAYRHNNRREEALKTCQEGLERFPLDAELLCEQGLLQRDQSDFRGAEKSWLDLLDARRGQYFASEEMGLRGFRTRQLVAEIYRAQERRLESEVQWRAALTERPDFEPAWVGLAELYLRSERWPELEYFLQDLENKGLDAAKVGWLRARSQVQRGELAAARRTLTSAVAYDPSALGPRVLLSQVLLQEGRDWAAAERALREVLEIDPNHAETRHNLRVLLRRLGRNGASPFEHIREDAPKAAILSPSNEAALAKLYEAACTTPSDINEHLPTLYTLAKECRHVTEMGTRTGLSTSAFLYARPEKLVCYDLVKYPQIDHLAALAAPTELIFHQQNVLSVEIESTDLLFLDTCHVYEQLREEFRRHARKVRKYIVLHDTTTFGERGERKGHRGLWLAVVEFLAEGHFQLHARYENNNGLTILKACAAE